MALFIAWMGMLSAESTQIQDTTRAVRPVRSVYLANSGNDSNPGTADAPWRTLGRLSSEHFGSGDTIYLEAGDVWHEPLVVQGLGGGAGMGGLFERVINDTGKIGSFSAHGWVVRCPTNKTSLGASGCQLPQGSRPLQSVNVNVLVDGKSILPNSVAANESRPDLVQAGAAPDPFHGFNVELGPGVSKALQSGNHSVTVQAVGCGIDSCGDGWTLGHVCICDGDECGCENVPDQNSPQPPVTITTTNHTGIRPKIQLNPFASGKDLTGAQTFAVKVSQNPWVVIQSIMIEDSISGIEIESVGGHDVDGTVVIKDCFFKNVYNWSSVGQSPPGIIGRDCYNGWSRCISAGRVGSLEITNNLFDNFDIAFLPSSTILHPRFEGNTMKGGNGNVLFMTASLDWQIRNNIFTGDNAPRFFKCGTTDIMVGGRDSRGVIESNEFGQRGEHPASPDGCAIDYEGGSDSVAVIGNLIHDSYGAGVMVFGLSDHSNKIQNATISDNIFVRNGARQTSDDHGEIALMEKNSTGVIVNNTFFAVDPSEDFVFWEPNGDVKSVGWVLNSNTIYNVSRIKYMIAPTPAIGSILYQDDGSAIVSLTPRHPDTAIKNILWTLDGSWPQLNSPTTTVQPTAFKPPNSLENATIRVTRSAPLNIRFQFEGMIESFTMTLIVPVPAPF